MLGIVSAVVAIIVFLKSFDWKSVVILVFGVAAALLFMQGMAESKKK
jgi:cell division protein FtsW (lipid II flippase)